MNKMFALGIPKRQYRRTTQVLGPYMSSPTNYDATKQDDGFYLFTFPDIDEDEFRNLVDLLKRNGVTTIGADSQLTEKKIMKLSNLIKEAELPPYLLSINYLVEAWNSIYDPNFVSIDPPYPIIFDLGSWVSNFYNTVQGAQNPENVVMNQANAWAEIINNAQTNQVIIAVKPDIAMAVLITVFAATAPAIPSKIIISPAKYIEASPKFLLSL